MISFSQQIQSDATADNGQSGLLRCAIVAAESTMRDFLVATIVRRPDAEVVAVCDVGSEAIESIRFARPDLVFLDARLPDADGFAIAEELGDDAPAIAVVTDTEEHAVRAFDVRALDCLILPLDTARISRTIDRARALSNGGAMHPEERPEQKSATPVAVAPEVLRYIPVRDGERIFLQKVDDVSLFESEGKSVRLHVAARKHSVRQTMNNLEKSLDASRFLRINRFAIVNIDHVHHLEPWSHGEWVVILKTGHRVVSTRGYHAGLRKLLGAV
ncbi:MAG TPA: LytTR family DNA-binding domain-containing protein [Gemmatimonadaceae bacterium]|nr:LytTR family DNA-binding domain-containing protein [Gemmatimonadaceae bacterium]